MFDKKIRKIHEPYPPKTSFEVGFGHCGGEWFVGIRPPIDEELLRSAGGKAIENWDVVDAFGETTSATVLKSTLELSESDVRGVGIALVVGLQKEIVNGVIFLAGAIEMAPNTAPFQNLQPRT